MDLDIVEETRILKTFSAKVADLGQDDNTLLRFLRARDGNLEKAEEMLRKSLKWRKDNRVGSYTTWMPPQAIVEDYVFEYLGEDKFGFPVVYLPLGRWNVRDRIEEGYLEETFDFRFYFLEAVLMKAFKAAKNNPLVLIIDMAELSFYKVAHIKTMNMITTACQEFDANFPETLKTSFVINAPWVFPYAFSLVKPWLAPKTLGKVKIFDSSRSKWLSILQETIPTDILPKRILS